MLDELAPLSRGCVGRPPADLAIHGSVLGRSTLIDGALAASVWTICAGWDLSPVEL